MLVIVGHGPSINRGRGAWLDQQTVVRLKWAERPDAENWGTRTDFVCASTPSFWTQRAAKGHPALDAEFWFLANRKDKSQPGPGMRRASDKWLDYWDTFRTDRGFPKPSTGLRAVFCALEFLAPAEIGLIGFDMVLHPEVPTWKWFAPPGKFSYAHEAEAERRCLMSLDVKITEV
jgi:hypothetical protein